MIAYCNAWFPRLRARDSFPEICRSQGNSHWERAVLAVDDQTLLEVRKQGSRHSASRLSARQSIIRNDKIDGVAIDRNLTKSDNFGGSVLWLSTS